jgi:hypothetical protein
MKTQNQRNQKSRLLNIFQLLYLACVITCFVFGLVVLYFQFGENDTYITIKGSLVRIIFSICLILIMILFWMKTKNVNITFLTINNNILKFILLILFGLIIITGVELVNLFFEDYLKFSYSIIGFSIKKKLLITFVFASIHHLFFNSNFIFLNRAQDKDE